MSTADARATVLEGQPADPAQVAGWLDRLHGAALALLPEQFTVAVRIDPHADGGVAPLTLTFHRHAPEWDLGEVQYRVTEAITVPHLDDTGTRAITVPADALCFTGQWLNRHRIPRPLSNSTVPAHDFGNRLIDAIGQDPIADEAILVAELVRVVRLRQRVGESTIRNGGHDTDIDDIQNRLHATFSITSPSTSPSSSLSTD